MKQPGRKSAASLAIVPPEPVEDRPASLPPAPDHITAESAAWWDSVVRDFAMEPHHLRLLQCAAEAWDKMQAARREIADHGGLTFRDSGGNIKAHPANAIERDARVAFARLVRELDLDADSGPAERSRPPALHSNRRGA